MIKPTVGRVVLYTPAVSDPLNYDKGDKLAAIVCKVWSDTRVNLAIFDANGKPANRTSVPLMQDGAQGSTEGGYCEWMEYQKGQAAKTESLEEKVATFGNPV